MLPTQKKLYDEQKDEVAMKPIKGHPFKAKTLGTCALCKLSIELGEVIVRLERGIRTATYNSQGFPAYFVRLYAHDKCRREWDETDAP